MAEPVRKIVIAGGGTAGWLSAVFLRDILPETVDITLVESPNIPTIGMGEATLPTFGNFLSFIGIDEHDWMPACAATFKNGILFRNWCGGNGPKSFLHPFYEDRGETFPIDQFWLQHYYDSYRRGRCLSFPPLPETCWTQAQLMLQGKAPVGSDNGSALRLRHAWHLDVSLLAKFLQQRAIKGGVRHIVDDIIAVRRSETKIESVQTKQHGHIDGEMFIDCTGFRRVLIGEFQGRFIYFGRYLLNDCAVAARLPHRAAAAAGLDPYTTATAMKCGWMWSIPLNHRIGTGYVYSSRFISDEDAEREFIEHSGADPDRCMRIRFQTGHLERPWEGNCVAIVSAGKTVDVWAPHPTTTSGGTLFLACGADQRTSKEGLGSQETLARNKWANQGSSMRNLTGKPVRKRDPTRLFPNPIRRRNDEDTSPYSIWSEVVSRGTVATDYAGGNCERATQWAARDGDSKSWAPRSHNSFSRFRCCSKGRTNEIKDGQA